MTSAAAWVCRRWWVAVITVAVLVALGVGVILSQRVADQIAPLMEQTTQIPEVDKRIATQKDLLQYQTDNQVKIWTTLAQATLAIAATIGGYFTWRNLRVTHERLDVDRQAQITNRFTQAIGQLGAELKDGKPNLEVRLGGIYALERIASDSPRDHWTIMEILTAYVRQNARWEPSSPSAGAAPSSEVPQEVHEPPQLRTDIQAILTVLGRRMRSEDRVKPAGLILNETWFFMRLDLHETDLRRADLQRAHLDGANLLGAHLERAHLRDAQLAGAILIGAHLERADLSNTHLDGANLLGAHLERAHLRDAQLDGANLSEAHLDGTDLRSADGLTSEVDSALDHGHGALLPADWRDRPHL